MGGLHDAPGVFGDSGSPSTSEAEIQDEEWYTARNDKEVITMMYHWCIYTLLRERYPNPVSYNNRQRDDDYCVGGAVVRHLNHGCLCAACRFPARENLAQAITALTNRVFADHDEPHHLADTIIVRNDEGQYEDAWTVLHAALCEVGAEAYRARQSGPVGRT